MDQKQYTTKTTIQKLNRTEFFPSTEKENLTLSGPPDFDSKYSINQVFNLHDPLHNITLSKTDIEKFFLPNTEKKHLNCYKSIKTLTQSLDN